jgi:hypothetical protein
MRSKYQILVLSILFALTSIGTYSCKKDEVVAENPTAARDLFLGTYNVSRGCTVLGIDAGDFTNITAGSASNAIVIDGSINATVSGGSFTMVKQTINGVVLSGSGGLSGKTLTMTLTLTQGTSSTSCNLTCDKQ